MSARLYGREPLWTRVEKSDECWLFTGPVGDGYGRIWVNGQRKYAHVAAYEQIHGHVPEGLVIDHLCRNRSCVNPAHLEPVTNRENVLRGNGITAVNARKTHCVHGHPFDDVNTQ